MVDSFKKTKAMASMLQERSKRQRHKLRDGDGADVKSLSAEGTEKQALKSLVESVKRKSAVTEGGIGKRRKV